MKKSYYLIVLVSLISLSSCQKFLDTKPTDFLAPSNYFTTEAQLNYARLAVYNMLGEDRFSGNGTYLYGWTADEAYMNRTSTST
jgi:hypothetical protein